MTQVNITTTKNTVSVTEEPTTVVTVSTVGPQGPKGIELDQTAKVDKSVIYYDSASGEFKADATWTIDTIVLGGNF